MKTLHKLMIAGALMFAIASTTKAQNADAKALLKQGVALHDQGKYPEAIDKYQQALKIDPTFSQAEFELSFSLYASGKGSEAITHLEKIIKDPKDPELAAQACDILGSIYDDSQQADKAIEAYQKGISINPKYQRLRYNLSLAYLREKKYPEAEAAAIEAIKLDPRHASSQNVYAAALKNQGKDVFALMAYCNFLLLEPQTKRSAECFAQLDAIIKSKFKITGDKSVTIFVKDHKEEGDADMFALETGLSLSAATALDKKNLPAAEILQDELKTVFGIAGELSAKKKDKTFFWKFYADYFGKLSQTDNMDAFTHFISLSANPTENQQWFKDHPGKIAALNSWITSTQHEF